ncbi:MAG: DUF1295 domain-containing protein [Myxococcota bacterium]|nr:DUF1295 domain-containing protein [Myxococcota bacterium]
MTDSPADLSRARLWILVAYLVAAIAALLAGIAVGGRHPIEIAAVADLAATVAVFAFSVAFRNSSFYDPYWSVVPPAIALYWVLAPDPGSPVAARQALVLALVFAWGIRLTHNWARGWTGLDHEDWRYRNIQEQTGALYWPSSFLGIHLFPTVMVFLGCLPLFPALASGGRPLGVLDGLAVLVTAGGIALELFADNQLRRFRDAGPEPGAILDTGLWAWSRHPNYLGEMLFWWGLALFGWAAGGFVWWLFVGAIAMVAMFRFASLPMIETRMAERRPLWDDYCARVPLVLPRPPR